MAGAGDVPGRAAAGTTAGCGAGPMPSAADGAAGVRADFPAGGVGADRVRAAVLYHDRAAVGRGRRRRARGVAVPILAGRGRGRGDVPVVVEGRPGAAGVDTFLTEVGKLRRVRALG